MIQGRFIITLAAWALLAAGVGVAAGCGGEDGERPPTGEATGSPSQPLTIDEARSLSAGEEAWVQGSLLHDGGELRLCSALLESYPPQCGQSSILLEGVELEDIPGLTRTDPDFEGPEVAWSDFTAVLRGTVENGVLTTSPPPAWEAKSGQLRFRFGHLPAEIRTDAGVNWLFDVINESDAPIELTFPSGQRGDVVLSDGGDEVYRWGRDRIFTQAVETIPLPAGRRIGFALEGTLDSAPGTYDLEATITSSDPEISPVEGEVTLKAE